ncbi:methyl-accepting chemotaxis protein [Clostridium magnum]|uniref:Methyl-accepting chemotaxis protein McpB n=1 Tax=Clostridium magnum DSM 2767 TaxID=1121326 RepID=A0A162RC41_9CLOT|nr:methyl-accepting chemotaxis protein [Clostridium magnum]KZL89694.1 methyl-accepting chemotaxis protein McpB [Clostridium magnum DSM 2767]SHH76603.1 methyl-accepting chemotaxis sensory transducer with Cache sensor [Clostridium magnum DSM 2767]
MKSIKSKMIMFLGLLIGSICIGLGTISFINSSKALESNLSKTLPKIAEQTASSVQGRIEGHLTALENIAARPEVMDPNNSSENKVSILLEEGKRIGSVRLEFVEKNGDIRKPDGTLVNVKERTYFQNALSGKSNVSDPFVSKTGGTIVVVYAVPVKHNNEVVGVLIETADGNKLSELTNQVKVGQTGYAFMIKKDGTNIASINKDLVMNMYNPIEEAKKDTKLQALADIEKKMGAGEIGIGEYYYNGVHKYVGYAPVKGTEWSVGVIVLKGEILSELDSLRVSVAGFSILFILIGAAIVYIIANSISKGIKSTSKHLELLAQGNLSEEVSPKYLQLRDEVGHMTNSMKVMQESLRGMINRIKENSANIDMQSESLSAVAEEIASSSQNVTEAINEIAKGTSSQSEDLVNVTDILNHFSNNLSKMVSEIQVMDSNAREISLMAEESSSEMSELNGSVTKVSNSFKTFNGKIVGLGKDINEINEITNIINSIAEQTNLLALNAAIEAARAGELGKGFAVVADEIRKLAEQSKVSSENISRLINGISKNTDVIVQDSVDMDNELINQVEIINSSITSFQKIIEAVNEVIPKIETVKNSAEGIDRDKNTILARVNDVSSVSIEVSASSEEISASSEEMNASTEEVSSSAQILSTMTKEMLEEVNKFKI